MKTAVGIQEIFLYYEHGYISSIISNNCKKCSESYLYA